jgi:hypothetical protein
MEERPPIWRTAANITNKQLWTADKGWFSSLGVGKVLTTPHCKKALLQNIHTISLGARLILWYELSNEKGM